MSALKTADGINQSSTTNVRCFLTFKQNSMILFRTIFFSLSASDMVAVCFCLQI